MEKEHEVEVLEMPPARSNPTVNERQRLAAQPVTASSGSFYQNMNASPEEKLAQYRSEVFEEEERPDLPPIASASRKCTDCLCLLLFIAYWIGQLGIAGFGWQNGDPNVLIYGTDHLGNLCGTEEFVNRQVLALPRLAVDAATAAASNLENVNFFGICATTCPKAGDIVCTDKAEDIIANDPGNDDRDTILNNCLGVDDSGCIDNVIKAECFVNAFDTTNFLFRCLPEFVLEVIEAGSDCLQEQDVIDPITQVTSTICARLQSNRTIVTEEPEQIDLLSSTFNTISREIEALLFDIYEALDVVGGVGMGLSLALSIVYVSLLWCVVGPLVWFSICAIVIVSLAFTIYLYNRAGILSFDELGEILVTVNENLAPPPADPDFAGQYEIAAYVFTGITVLLFLIILCLIPQIARAIKFFKEASHTLRANLQLLIMPPVSAFFSLINAMFFIATVAFVLSLGDIVVESLDIDINLDENNVENVSSSFVPLNNRDYLILYLLLGFLWTTNVIAGISTMIISHVVAQSYWETEPGTIHYKRGSLCRAFHQSFRFHLGTAAFGGILIALVQLVRIIAAFIDNRTKTIQENNRLVKYLLKSIHCCLYCAELCVKYASKNAYILTAMYGSSFCRSSRMAFFSIASNLAQVGAVNFLGQIIIRFGQLLITILCTGISLYLLDGKITSVTDPSQLGSITAPLILVVILAWVISGVVLNIYDVAVDTLLLSYCQDRKRLKLRGHGKDDVKPKNGEVNIQTVTKDTKGLNSFKEFMKSHRIDEANIKKQNSLFAF